MKEMKRVALVLALVFLVGVVLTAPAAARGTVGERVVIMAGVPSAVDLVLETPFYIEHGHGLTKDADTPRGLFGFNLYVDDVLQKPDYRSTSVEQDVLLGPNTYPWMMFRTNVYNFPEGMTGSHTFKGVWTGPCQWAVENAGYSGTCDTPNAVVAMWTGSTTVNFVE